MSDLMAVQIGVSVFLGVPAIYMVLSKRYTPREKNWAYSTLGLILGFWLRGKV
jgi:hypothetical protein